MSELSNHHNLISRGYISPWKRCWDENGVFSLEKWLESKGEKERLFM
jgi:hypothetical protein